jgi:hypothetical protein
VITRRRRHPGWVDALQLLLTAMLAWLLLIGVVWLAIEAVAR